MNEGMNDGINKLKLIALQERCTNKIITCNCVKH